MTRLQHLLMATVAWGVLAFGAVYPWAYWPMAVAAFGLGVWAWRHTEAWRDPRLRVLALALAAVAIAIGLQLVPLPYDLNMRLSPSVDAFRREYLLGYQRPPTHALSIDPTRSGVALALFVALATLLVGLTRALRYMRLDWLMTQVLGLGLGLAVVGVVQKAFIEPTDPLVYGFWRPVYGGNPFGPFINRNHFAGWMVMALPPVIGYAIAELERAVRPRVGSWRIWLQWVVTTDASRFVLASVAALSMGMSIVLTGSRSGLASLVVATVVLGYYLVRRTASPRGRVAAAAAMCALIAIALVWAGPRELVSRFAETAQSVEGRFGPWRDSWQIIRDFPVFGTGLGTYGLAMLVYQTSGRPEINLQAHNDYIQLAAEGGLLVTIPALVLLVVIVRTIWRRMTSGDDDAQTRWIRIGAVAGLLGIAAQSLVEFSLQMPGNTLLFTVVLAIAMHRPSRSPRARRV
jgi:O-antigen ligase